MSSSSRRSRSQMPRYRAIQSPTNAKTVTPSVRGGAFPLAHRSRSAGTSCSGLPTWQSFTKAGNGPPEIQGRIEGGWLGCKATTDRKSDRGRNGEIGQDKRGRTRCFFSNGVRIGVRPVARSPYSASRIFHMTGFPLEKRRWHGSEQYA